jgi:hypothetical protein
MGALREAELDAYSRIAVRLILARFPDWEPLATLLPRPDGAGNTVEFTIPCQSQAAEYGLWVSTADEELTVGFHTHHNHFTDYENPLNEETIHAGIQHAAEILNERAGIVSWYSDGAFTGSRSVRLPHAGPLPGLLSDLGRTEAELAEILPDCDRATLRSWLGLYDREEVR